MFRCDDVCGRYVLPSHVTPNQEISSASCGPINVMGAHMRPLAPKPEPKCARLRFRQRGQSCSHKHTSKVHMSGDPWTCWRSRKCVGYSATLTHRRCIEEYARAVIHVRYGLAPIHRDGFSANAKPCCASWWRTGGERGHASVHRSTR